MRTRRMSVAVLSLALIVTPGLTAQGRPPSRGELVRVTTSTGAVRMGTLGDTTALTLQLLLAGDTISLDRSSVDGLAVLRTRSRSRAGAVTGGLLFGFAGAALAHDAVCDGGRCTNGFEVGVYGFAIGAPAGAVLGALVGLLFKTDRWEPVVRLPVG